MLAQALPFTAEQFFSVFARYNAAVWPAPLVAYGLAAVAIVALLRETRAGTGTITAVLALFWLWTGIAYFWLAFSAINRAAWPFGALYIGEAELVLWLGVWRERLHFRFANDLAGWAGIFFIAYATILYPVLGYGFGHRYPAIPTFGITPCPVTIFTFGVLLLARSVPWPLLVVSTIWSLIGGSAAILLRVPQDWLLLVSGPLTLILLWRAGRIGSIAN